MRNDPFTSPAFSLTREAGHVLGRSAGKMPHLTPPLHATGVPLGGIGTGTITRASDGRFSRWTVQAGGVKAFDLPANGFVLRVDGEVRGLQPAPEGAAMGALEFEPETPEWAGLFPLAWHRHQSLREVRAECLSFSPVIPGDLDTASLPVALFRWRLSNEGVEAREVSLGVSFANLNGWFDDFGEAALDRVPAGCFNRELDIDGGLGVEMTRAHVDGPAPGDGSWGIAVADGAGLRLSRSVCFDGLGDGAALAELSAGALPDTGSGWLTEGGFREVSPGLPTGAVAASLTLAPGEVREVTFALGWDLPVIRFGQGRRWHRGYTDRWRRDGTAIGPMLGHALAEVSEWERRLSAWHDEVAEELGAAPWRAGLALNELYFVTEGLSVLTSAHGAPDGWRHFGLIECHDYALYNTMDLWIYASEAVGRHWPELAAMVAEDFAAQTVAEDLSPRRERWSHEVFGLNPAGQCPHDLGGPGEDPFVAPNSYTYRDATRWKDLNADLVLCIWREGARQGRGWLAAQYGAVKVALDHLAQFDRDGDGLIENEGFPDQTFDNIPMTGPSSYCSGLWLAALRAGARFAEAAGEAAQAAEWDRVAARGVVAYEDRLWGGDRYLVDTDGPFREAVFIEQLLGPYLAKALGLGNVVAEDRARTALRTVFTANFLEAGGGEGAVSLARIPEAARAALPHKDDTSFQTAEIQPGFNFSLAAQLECWGLRDEAEQLRKALWRELHVKRNLVCQTPAAFDRGRMTCRAVLNMRPLAAWWMG